MDASLFPEPDSEFGYSEHELTSILGDRMANFHEYMLMKLYALGGQGAVYYPSDESRYVEHVIRLARFCCLVGRSRLALGL